MVQTLNSDFQSPDELPASPLRGGASSVKAPFVLVLIAMTVFLPEETSFYFGELRITICRILLLLIAPAILFRFARLTAGGNYRFVWSDVLVPVTGLWMFVGPAKIDGFGVTVVYSGISALEFCIPYMATRVFLTERGQAVALVRILCIAIATVGLLAILDEVSGRFVLREIAGSFTGYHTNRGFNYSILSRGFLFRAASTLEHPILLGTACLVGLLMATTMRGGLRQFMLAGSAVGLALSVSSAPIGGAVIGFGALLYDKLMRNFPFRWGLLLASGAGVILFIFSAAHSPWGFIFNYLSFDPSSAYYRLLQWQWVGPIVMNSPIFGIGLSGGWVAETGLAPTIDANWLRTAMVFGIPGSILVGLSYITPCSVSMDIGNKSLNLTKQERQLGSVLSLILGLFIYIGFTAFYWGTVSILISFLAGIRAHLGALAAMPREPGLDDGG
jgi:hypothetical protein